MMSIASLLQQTAKKFSEKIALEFEEQQITFNDLDQTANRIANAYHSLGILKGDRVAHFTSTSPELIFSLLANFKNGSIIVPVNAQFKGYELLHILNDSGAKAIVTDNERLPLIRSIQSQLPHLREIILMGGKEGGTHSLDELIRESFSTRTSTAINDEDIAAIFYTSGTTGKPKGVALTNHNITSNLEILKKVWQWSPDDVLLHTLQLNHVHGFGIALCGSLMVGNKIILRKKFDAKDVLETIQQKRVTLFMGVPTMYFKLLEEKKEQHDLTSMRLFISGSAPLSKELFHRFSEAFGFEILERAGMSETMINFSNPVDGKRMPGSVGFPLPTVQARIVNDQLQDQPLNAEGEIVLKGENVFHGYWNNFLANSESFCNGWFLTGDIGKMDEAGYVYIEGRKKDVIKSGGILIFPKEIEEVIETMPGVKECAVIGVADEIFGEAIKACVVIDCETLSPEALISFCKHHLASFKKPKHVEFFETLPKNAMGKILKEELRKSHSQGG